MRGLLSLPFDIIIWTAARLLINYDVIEHNPNNETILLINERNHLPLFFGSNEKDTKKFL